MLINDRFLGGVKVAEQKEMTDFTQEAASAWAAADEVLNHRDLVGAPVYKPFAYVGEQVVRGINHVFFVERVHLTSTVSRHIWEVVVNQFAGEYTVTSTNQLY